MREALKLTLAALKQIDEAMPFAVAKLAIMEAEKALAQPEQEQQIETLKRCLFQMQEAAKDLVEQSKSLTPPQRTWVGLTKYEHDEILITSFNKVHHAIKLTQDKLKEKNT